MPQLNVNKQYRDGAAPTTSQLDAALDSITTFFNITGIGSDNIQGDSLSGQKLASGAVTETKIRAAAVTEDKIADNSVTLQKLAQAVQNRLMPPGLIRAHSLASAPVGWLLCDGAEVSRAAYPRLFEVIGVRHGGGDGTTTFNLPDYRGRFLRGVDGTAGRDPDSAVRTAMNTGGSVGSSVGSVQLDAVQNHRHNYPIRIDPVSMTNPTAGTTVALGDGVADVSSFASDRNVADSTAAAAESRPENAYVYWIIKT